jgi:hypothetical protein
LQAVKEVKYMYTLSIQMQANGSPEQLAALAQQAMGAMQLSGGGLGVMALPAGPSYKALPAPQGRRGTGGQACVVEELGSRGRSASRKPAHRW